MMLLREPLLHFAVVGAILFGGYSWLNDKQAEATIVEPVRLGDGDVRWLKQTWSSQWLREPTADELKGLVGDLLNEKLLAREAQEMGLEKDDTIIRRRLAQKLKFIVEDTAQLAEPTEAELRQFYAANPAHFETPGKLSFRQVYFNPEHRKDAAADATAALGVLTANVEDDSTEGDRLLFGDSFADTDELALSGMFGADFARVVFALEPGGWRGPVKSGYGFHLVLVTQHTATVLKPFETVRDAVLAEWRSAKQIEFSRDYLIAIVDNAGQKIQFSASGTATISRPGKLFITRKGPYADAEISFDGKTVSVYGKALNVYAQLASPGPTIDEEVRMATGMDAAGADLLSADPYAALMTEVHEGSVVDTAYISGIKGDHLAFRGDAVDWQIWIEQGERRLPMKYVITTKWVTGAPQYTVRFANWNVAPQIDATWYAPAG